jgi:hypothetical protein
MAHTANYFRIRIETMRRLLPCIAFVACFGAVASAMASGASDLAEVVGTWEGESICQVANSPCHDEHVIYEIAEEKEGKAKIEGYKIVNGEKQWMGTLLCDYLSAEHVLTCVPKEGKPSDWTFQIKDGTMSGTLVLPESKTLYRKMSLKRIRKGT